MQRCFKCCEASPKWYANSRKQSKRLSRTAEENDELKADLAEISKQNAKLLEKCSGLEKLWGAKLEKLTSTTRLEKGSGVLEVHVQSAEGLRAADSNGKSDPYAKVWLGELKEHNKQTKVVPKNLNPTWDERLCFRGHLAVFVAETLVIKVRDKDILGFDPLGEVRVLLGFDPLGKDILGFDPLGEVRVPLDALSHDFKLEFYKQPLYPDAERRRSITGRAIPAPTGSISFVISWRPDGMV